MKLQEALKTDRFRDEQHKATLNVLYTAYWFKSHLSIVFKEHGITEEQFNVMRILKGKHPEQMCVRDIASRMLEKNSNVPRIIDRLVAKKMVKRENSTEDKRETLISLTAKGIEQLEKVSKQVETKSNDIINLSDEEANQLHNLLEKLREEEK
ncbi:MAG TPA: MarR family transcriptional regulator [Flavipsychrobacter sp.]|nr:MarR family transcriptional regulator [Flavipsychrobacter sp.]